MTKKSYEELEAEVESLQFSLQSCKAMLKTCLERTEKYGKQLSLLQKLCDGMISDGWWYFVNEPKLRKKIEDILRMRS